MSRYPLRALALLLVAGTVMAGDKNNLELTEKNFGEILESKDPFMVLFYAPWCGHCKAIFPKWKKAAAAADGIVKFAQVNADSEKGLGGRYQIQGFPTIKVFGADKKKPADYQGPREVDGLITGALNAAKSVINERLHPGGGGGGGGGSSTGNVVELTDGTFDKTVIQSDDLWIVSFTAPWCGHCKNLAPEFERASNELKGRAKMGNVDATQNQQLAQRFGVQSYPTIKAFLGGKKTGDGVDYEGGRAASDFVHYAEEELLKTMPPPEVKQLTSADIFANDCTAKQLCFVAFLPFLQDSGKDGRDSQIDTMKALAEQYKRRPFGWVWVEATAQGALENAFGVADRDKPTVVALNAKKLKYSNMVAAFSVSGISSFVNKLIAGRGGHNDVQGELPAIQVTEAWNGKDFVPDVVEEEFDLSELMGDDEDDDGAQAGKDEL